MAITNATRLSDFAAGIGTEGAILKIDNANQRVGIGTQLPDQMLQVAGIVSATQYIGDGSLLEGITSAGLGTAIDDTDGSAGAVIYYTNDLLTVTETTTVNPPTSASAAYTQYRDVKLEDNVDLIIETGDDFIPDVLGLGTDASDPTLSGNGVFDEVYTSLIKNKDGLGAPVFPNGLTSVGVITATGGFSGNATGILNNSDNVTIASDESDTVSQSSIRFKTDGTEKVRIVNSSGSGCVGISTGNIDPDGNKLLIRGASTIGTNKGHIMLTGDSSVVGEGPQIVFSESGPGANWAGAYIGHTRQGGGSLGDLRFGTRAAAGDANTVPTERLRISSNGAFGIGGANYGTSGQVLTSQGSNAAPQWAEAAGGMSEYDVWTITSGGTQTEWDYGIIGASNGAAYGNSDVSIARCTTTQNPTFTKLGTGMSYSSGVWTFPSTGYWEIITNVGFYITNSTERRIVIDYSADGGSTWMGSQGTFGGIDTKSTAAPSNYSAYVILNTYMHITNASNQKIRYLLKTSGPGTLNSSTGNIASCFTFKKVA